MHMLEFHSLVLSLGGLGLFLLGMVIMTDGLKRLAGDRLRSILFEFTRTPTSGATTGAITTAIVQSSSATTVAAVGFVGAGLMTFPNALGIIFGANVGTTITGWLVALLGFKFSIDNLALPLILLGVLLHLFSKGKVAQGGLALAGFGLLFVGLDTMQIAMVDMRSLLDFTQLPADNFWGLIKLLLIGLLFTVVTQSSSAGVAVTLTALFTGLIEFEQAAALVIGMDVGTTVTSLIASIGGTVGAKRTGLSHVVYNALTAVLALLLIAPYTLAWSFFAPGELNNYAELALVGFHTLFNAVGVLAILPFAKPFARLIERLVPDKPGEHTQRLEPQLLNTPEMALNAVQNTLIDLTHALVTELQRLMHSHPVGAYSSHLEVLQIELDQTQSYLDHIHLHQSDYKLWGRLTSMIHALDHLQRLHERCEEEADRAEASKKFPTLSKATQRLSADLSALHQHINNGKWTQAVNQSQALHQFIKQDAEDYRHKMVQKMGQGEIDANACWDALEAIRWMERVSKHLYRINYHLQKMLLSSGK